jgi:hypothetical protein
VARRRCPPWRCWPPDRTRRRTTVCDLPAGEYVGYAGVPQSILHSVQALERIALPHRPHGVSSELYPLFSYSPNGK